MMTRRRSTPSCAKIACCASPDRPAAQVCVEIGTPVAFWARAEARSTVSITGVTPAVSVAHLMMPALTPLVPMPRVMSRTDSSATASTPWLLKYRCGIHQTPVATITRTRERRATATIKSMSRPRSTVVRSTIVRMPRLPRSAIFRSASARTASRSKRWGQFSCTPGERVTMCSCISVGPSSAVATGPSAVSTVVMLTSRSEESIVRAGSSSSAPDGRRGALDQVLRAGLNPGEEAGQHDAHPQPGIALHVGGGDQRARHAAGLDDLRQRPVDRPLNPRASPVADPDDRGHAPEVAGPREATEIGVVDAAVLALQPDSVWADRTELIDQVGVVGAGQNRRDLAGGELLFHAIRSNVHVVSLTCAPASAPRSGPSARQSRGHGVRSSGVALAVVSMAQDASLD